MSSEPSSTPPFRIETLKATYDAYGMVLDLLSRHTPFSEFRLSQISETVRAQLKKGHHVAALSPSNDLVGYAGWVYALKASAELWLEDRGPLKVLDENYDAVAITIVVSEVPSAAGAMMRHCRTLNPDLRAYFKRSYGGQLPLSRKNSVQGGHVATGSAG